jgi:hypothetical protein
VTNLLGSLGRAAKVALDQAGPSDRGPAPARSDRPRRCFPDSVVPEDGCVPDSAAPSEGCFPEPHGRRSAHRAGHPR